MFKFKKSLFLLSLLLFSQNIFAWKKKFDPKPEILSDICSSIANTFSVEFYPIDSVLRDDCRLGIYNTLMCEYGASENLSFINNIINSENLTAIANDFAKVLLDIKYIDSSCYVDKVNYSSDFDYFGKESIKIKLLTIFTKFKKESIYERMNSYIRKPVIATSGFFTLWTTYELINGSVIARIMIKYYGGLFIVSTYSPKFYKWVSSLF